MRKVVALTGGSGLLAVNLAVLMARQYDVYLFLHKRSLKLKGITTEFLDLASPSVIISRLQELKVDILINCAALTNIETCEKDPDSAIYVNATIANNIALACSTSGVKLIHISTDHLYDGKDSFYTEEDSIKPLNLYGYSKALGEDKVLKSCQKSLVLRTNFFGWGLPYRKSFSDFILTNLENQTPLYLFTDVFFTLVLMSQLFFAISSLIQLDENGVFNVSTSDRISKYDFGCCLAKVFSCQTDLIKSSLFLDRGDLIQRPLDMSLSNKKLITAVHQFNDDINTHIHLLNQLPNNIPSFVL